MTTHARCTSWIFRFLLASFSSLMAACLTLSAPPQHKVAISSSMLPDLKSRADSGDRAAQILLFEFLVAADATVPGYDLALSWLQSSAAQNVATSQFLMGYLYQQGKGLPCDFAKAAENYRAAALQGYSAAENNLASLYQHGRGVPRDESLAFHWYHAAAMHGNPAAQQNVGTFYFLGYGTRPDPVEAAKWFRASADQGFAPGQNSLAYAYLKGIGLPRDYSQAAYWARLAAEQGHTHSQALLGYLYETGEGLPLDYVSAYAWYSRAVAAGDNSNADRLKTLTQIMTRKQIQEASSLVLAQTHPPEPDAAAGISSVRSLFPEP